MKPRLTTRILKYILIASVVIAIAIALLWVGLQGYSMVWTGFGDFQKPNSDFVRGKTLWDWMQLFIIPIFLSVGVFLLNLSERNSERKRAEERSSFEREIAADRQREAAFQSYLDRMADLLLKEKLRTTENAEARDVARMRTLTVLLGLDSRRKGMVILFLQESGLITKVPVIHLNSVNLSNAYLGGALLNNANLSGANLTGANLSYARLNEAILSVANLTEANLINANLNKADLSGAVLYGAGLSDSKLIGAHLEEANLCEAKLRRTDLMGAYLNKAELTSADLYLANLSEANLQKANLVGANLQKANLMGADLTGADLGYANLDNVNLSRANLTGAKVSNELLATTHSLEGTTMPDGTKHE
jgi:uncharacterized protein YjbI with pentapeptide repeats